MSAEHPIEAPLRFALFEDQDVLMGVVKQLISNAGHYVSAEAGSMDEARVLLDELTGDELDAAIVDGNLSSTRIDGEDGKEIVKKLRETHPYISIIGWSSSVEGVSGASTNILKTDFEGLAQAIISFANGSIKAKATSSS